MANVFVRTNQQRTVDASKEISYRNIDRVTAQLDGVNSTYSYAAINVPFAQGLIKRITIFSNGDSDTAAYAEVIVSENNTTNKENKILHYSNINVQSDYLDSQEDVYYNTTDDLIYIHMQATGGSANFYIRLDIERVN